MAVYYFDTSIWLDYFEKRDQYNLKKGKHAEKLLEKVIHDTDKIIITDLIYKELRDFGYLTSEIKRLFYPLTKTLLYVDLTRKQMGKAKDISKKRAIPLLDAAHMIIARDNRAVLVTRDSHFKKLSDIGLSKTPEELLGIFFIFLS
jgi:predicted nucleic acid-binding protein